MTPIPVVCGGATYLSRLSSLLSLQHYYHQALLFILWKFRYVLLPPLRLGIGFSYRPLFSGRSKF